MHKAIHTQGISILLDEAVDIGHVRRALADFEIDHVVTPGAGGGWLGGGATVVMAMNRDANGTAVVDVMDHPWPDKMGSPTEDPTLFGAWGMGYFGPFAWPHGLSRSVYWSPDRDKSTALIAQHRAFVRVRTTYVGGKDEPAPMIPEGYDPVSELLYLTDVAKALLAIPGALAYFNPNGEVLLTKSPLEDGDARARNVGLLPLPCWCAVRHMHDDREPAWTIMDTVGMQQLDVPDHQACFRADELDRGAVRNFLYNVADYIRQNGSIIDDGDTTDAAGIRWRGRKIPESSREPPRELFSWTPAEGEKPPRSITGEP